MEQEVTEEQRRPPDHDKLVHVSVYTTSGAFPRKGHQTVPASQHVSHILNEAKHALHLTDTTDWVATVDGQIINPDKSYQENGLADTVVLHWGPREGGGGC